MKVIDGTDLLLGRMGTKVAKYLLSGEEVVILNAERIGVAGELEKVVEKYKRRRERKDKANPEHSAKTPRRPDLFVKRVIRGMLPFKSSRGREAFRRLKVYMGEPDNFKKAEKVDLSEISCKGVKGVYCSVGEVCRRLGYNKVF